MPATYGDDEIRFSSGRRMYANRNIVGIDEDREIFEGYDGGGPTWPIPDWWDDEEKRNCLNADDLRELADLMIDQWTKFKNSLQP